MLEVSVRTRMDYGTRLYRTLLVSSDGRLMDAM